MMQISLLQSYQSSMKMGEEKYPKIGNHTILILKWHQISAP